MSTIPIYQNPIQYRLPLGAPYGINASWQYAEPILIPGYAGEVMVVTAGRAGFALDVTATTPLMFLAYEDGQLKDVSKRLNINDTASVITRTLIVADLNGDGLQDIFLGNHGTEKFKPFPGEQNQLLIQNRTGIFLDKSINLPRLTDFTHGPDVGDLNGDGYIDIFVTNLGDDDSNPSYILVGNADGQFRVWADINKNKNGVFGDNVSNYLGPQFALVLDINQDGKKDIFYGPFTQWNGSRPVVVGYGYLENNKGLFDVKLTNELIWPQDASSLADIKKADFNRDGFDDILMIGTDVDAWVSGTVINSGMEVQVYYSGPGGMKNASSTSLDLTSLKGKKFTGGMNIQVSDINADGAPDFEIRTWESDFSGMVRFTFLNDGKGKFAAPIKNLAGVATSIGSYADINGDGATDFVYSSGGFISVLYGVAVSNFIMGSAGNDFLTGSPQTTNTVIYSGLSSEYKWTKSDSINNHGITYSGFTTSDLVVGRDGFDSLISIERLKFTDGSLALDIAPGQNAGEVYRLYQAAFARTPDMPGVKYHLNDMESNGLPLWQIASNFLASPEFASKYGSNPSDTQYINALYKNVLNRIPGESEVAWYQNQFTTKAMDHQAALIGFSESPENVALVGSAIANGIWLG